MLNVNYNQIYDVQINACSVIHDVHQQLVVLVKRSFCIVYKVVIFVTLLYLGGIGTHCSCSFSLNIDRPENRNMFCLELRHEKEEYLREMIDWFRVHLRERPKQLPIQLFLYKTAARS